MRTAARVPGLVAAVSTLGEPAAPTPPSGGLFHPQPFHTVLTGRSYPGQDLVKRVLLASPRGYCAGVERAVDTVERAIRLYGPPVYVRKQIVHNSHVVRDLEAKGAIFVEDETEVPEGAVIILSAHGVAPQVYENSARRRLSVI